MAIYFYLRTTEKKKEKKKSQWRNENHVPVLSFTSLVTLVTCYNKQLKDEEADTQKRNIVH